MQISVHRFIFTDNTAAIFGRVGESYLQSKTNSTASDIIVVHHDNDSSLCMTDDNCTNIIEKNTLNTTWTVFPLDNVPWYRAFAFLIYSFQSCKTLNFICSLIYIYIYIYCI